MPLALGLLARTALLGTVRHSSPRYNDDHRHPRLKKTNRFCLFFHSLMVSDSARRHQWTPHPWSLDGQDRGQSAATHSTCPRSAASSAVLLGCSAPSFSPLGVRNATLVRDSVRGVTDVASRPSKRAAAAQRFGSLPGQPSRARDRLSTRAAWLPTLPLSLSAEAFALPPLPQSPFAASLLPQQSQTPRHMNHRDFPSSDGSAGAGRGGRGQKGEGLGGTHAANLRPIGLENILKRIMGEEKNN